MKEKIFLTLFCIIIATPILFSGFTDNSYYIRKYERRNITSYPHFTFNNTKKYFEEIEKYINDRLGLREFYQKIYTSILVNIFQHSPRKDVLIGKNGWYFHNFFRNIETFLGLRSISKIKHELMLQDFSLKKEILKEKKIEYLVFIPPDKSSIYPEYYPFKSQIPTEKSLPSQLLSSFPSKMKEYIFDVTPELLENKKNKKLLFFKKDTHWNSEGIKIGTRKVYKKVFEKFNLEPTKVLDYENFYIDNANDLGNDLAHLIKIDVKPSELKAIQNLRNKCAIGQESNLVTEKWKLERSYICNKEKLSVLIFHDSYFEHAPTYLSEYFNRTLFVWDEFSLGKYTSLIEKFKPDIIVEEIVERLLLKKILD